MSDLISRQDVNDLMRKYGFKAPDMTIKEFVEDCIPSAESEQRKGEWVDGNGKDTFIHCSVCDKEAYWDTDYGQQEFDFCPYCGADMRGDQ